jgi:uncharacterized protein
MIVGGRSSVRQDVSFRSEGLMCRGWLYIPASLGANQQAPAVVLAHGFSGVKEMGLSPFAERLVAAGFVTLVFDFRYLGESEGEPRGQIFPLEQQADYRNAITWLSDHSRVDPDRIGIWGTSFSGGVVVSAAIFDKRIKAVVAQVPSVANWEGRRSVDPERFDRVGEMLLKDRITRYKTGAVNYLKVVAQAGEPCVLPQPESFEFFVKSAKTGSTWRNQVTVESLEKLREFDPVSLIHLIAPRALLLIAAETDVLTPFRLVQAAYERASEPKALLALSCGHFDVYAGTWAERAADAAVDWFKTHLTAQ